MIITSLISALVNRIVEYRAFVGRVRELDQLSDRELSELGISRADITAIAAAH